MRDGRKFKGFVWERLFSRAEDICSFTLGIMDFLNFGGKLYIGR